MRLLRTLPLLCAGLLASAQVPPRELLQAFDHMAKAPLWPGFEPQRMPLALYDGQRTWLFRHPKPPAEFHTVEAGAWVMEGRHEAVTSNSSAEIGGVMAATLMPAEGVEARIRAATLIHECFHVHQRARHPAWFGNEAELFAYPMEDADVLASRWQEEADLWHALRAEDRGAAKAFAARAMAAREARFARIGPAATAYERGSELNEGLASLVEYRALGRRAFEGTTPPRIGAEHLRDERFYAIGPALGQVLDRLAPGWEKELIEGRAASPDEVLRAATTGADAVGLPPVDPGIRVAATAAVSAVVQQRQAALEAYLARPGWSVEVRAGVEAPLFPERFDPWNVRRLSKDALLHTRFLKLANASGSLEMLGATGLTRAAGAHPLWNGVASFRICGLPSKPLCESQADGSLRFSGEGFRGSFRGYAASWEGSRLVLQPRP